MPQDPVRVDPNHYAVEFEDDLGKVIGECGRLNVSS